MSEFDKVCAACGLPVADSDLAEGATRDAEGNYHCPACSGEQMDSAFNDDGDVRIAFPDSPAAPAAEEEEPPSPAPEPDDMPDVPDVPEAPAASRPRAASRRNRVATRAARATSRRSKPTRATSARRKKQDSAREKPAAKPSSRRKKPARETKREKPPTRRGTRAVRAAGAGEDTSDTRRVSRRSSAQALPWYFRLSRNQIITIAGSAAGILLLVLIAAMASGGGSKRQSRRGSTTIIYTSRAHEMVAEAEELLRQNKREEAIKLLEAACQDAEKGGRHEYARTIRRTLYGLRFKTAY